MADMKCPFCQQKLGIGSIDGKWLVCFNCHITGNDKLWQELIRTRKSLDIAINVLNRVKDVKYEEYIDEKLEQINEIIKGGDNE